MNEKTAPIDPVQDERQRYRNQFWAAYDIFIARSIASVPAQLPDGDYTQPGGPHDPSWERWARWRAEFHLAGKRLLHGDEETIFSLHFCMGLSRRLTMERTEVRSHKTFASIENMIAEKMGKFIEDEGLWPPMRYFEEKVPEK